LPGGSYLTIVTNGSFGGVGRNGFWWTATESSRSFAYYRYFNNVDDTVDELDGRKSDGYSVRCLKD